MVDVWMIFTITYPFVVITLHCFKEMLRINEMNIFECSKNTVGKVSNFFAKNFYILYFIVKSFADQSMDIKHFDYSRFVNSCNSNQL